MRYIWFRQEKAPYEAKAAKKKSEYEKLMNAYNKKQVNTFVSIILTLTLYNQGSSHCSYYSAIFSFFFFFLSFFLSFFQDSMDDDGDEES